MSKRTNLLNGKPEGGFSGLAAVMLSFSMAFAVFAAGGIVLAGCDSPAGVANGYDGAVVFTEASAPGPESAGADSDYGLLSGSEAPELEIVNYEVTIKVANGGHYGLVENKCIVSNHASTILVKQKRLASGDHKIKIKAPKKTPYFIIRWRGKEAFGFPTYLKGIIYNEGNINKLSCYIDYNGEGKLATEGMSNVSYGTGGYGSGDNSGIGFGGFWKDFDDAWEKASSN